MRVVSHKADAVRGLLPSFSGTQHFWAAHPFWVRDSVSTLPAPNPLFQHIALLGGTSFLGA
jgi:hypothetical protein